MTTNNRIERLREKLRDQDLDAMLVSAADNRRYVSGFTGSAGYLLVSQGEAVLSTDFRYVEQAGRQAPAFRIERISGGLSWFPKLASELGVKRVGFEGRDVTVATYESLKRAVDESEHTDGLELVPTDGVVERFRTVKDGQELELIARAVKIADEAFEEVAEAIRPGLTERQVAWELEKAMRERGADGVAFDIIVAAGPNGALPHHPAGNKVMQNGDAVVIDMGAVYQGYCSDLTRTVVVGDPDETFRRVYDTVLGAQLAAEGKVMAGMTGVEADAIARDLIAEAGYADNFGHGLGHGVGLAVHELPVLSPRSTEPLEDGMVFSIEPGIYVPGWGGVRIEDMAVLEDGHVRVLTRAHKRERTG